MEQGKVVIKEPCNNCGATDYTWAAMPTDEKTGEATTQVPDACSNCHELDEDSNLHPKRQLN
jgi:hypothetical protein